MGRSKRIREECVYYGMTDWNEAMPGLSEQLSKAWANELYFTPAEWEANMQIDFRELAKAHEEGEHVETNTFDICDLKMEEEVARLEDGSWSIATMGQDAATRKATCEAKAKLSAEIRANIPSNMDQFMKELPAALEKLEAGVKEVRAETAQ